MTKPMDTEERNRLYRKICNSCAELCRKTGAAGALTIIFIPENGGYLHLIDGGSGAMPEKLHQLLRQLADQHERRAAGIDIEGFVQ